MTKLHFRRNFSSYTAIVTLIGAGLTSLVSIAAIWKFLPPFLWNLTQESTYEAMHSMEANIGGYLRVGDWDGAAQVLDIQNTAGRERVQFVLYRGDTKTFIGTPKLSDATLTKVATYVASCHQDFCAPYQISETDSTRAWRILVSQELQGYAAQQLRTLAIVSSKSIDNTSNHFLLLVAAMVLASTILSVFVSAFLLGKKLGRPLSALANSLRNPEISRKDLESILSQGVYEEVRITGEAIQQLWLRIELAEQAKVEQQKSAAIAQMTQMLAHDVRKPFSSILIALGALAKVKTPADVKKITELAVPEIRRSLESVNGLIQDVIEIDSKAQIAPERVNTTDFIEKALMEVFRVYSKANTEILYSLKHTRELNIEQAKVLRVFSNIIGNSVSDQYASRDLNLI